MYTSVDYRVIFKMSKDALNPKNLEICKQHIVFQHFPMQRLVENPSVWSVINYKYGQLIALDLHTIEWIYVIKSGEARVLKYLQPGKIDVKARRRKVQAMINNQSPFYRKKKILNFIQDREYIKSAYRSASYHPHVGERASVKSAPPGSSRRLKTASLLPHRACSSLPVTRQGSRPTPQRHSSSASLLKHRTSSDSNLIKPEITLPRLVLENADPSKDSTSDPPTDNDNKNGYDSKRKDDRSGYRHATPILGEPNVIFETVEELSGDLTSDRPSGDLTSDRPTVLAPSRRTSFQDDQQNQPKEDEAGHLTTPIGDGGGGNSVDSSPGYRSRRGSVLSIEAGGRGRRGSNLSVEVGGDRTGRRGSILSIDGNLLNVEFPEAESKRLTERRMSRDLTGGLFDKPRLPGQRRQSILVPVEGRPEGSERRPSILIPPVEVRPDDTGKARGRSGSFLKTPGTARSTSPNSRRESKTQVIQVGNHTLPAFVQIETLHPGQVFGLRACLDEEERGPSVSLVSGECEVLQINKKFFMRHCDDAIYSLIRLKNKPFPSEEDLIDRLDINMQWEEYKQQTLHDFLRECRAKR